ncbi:MAG: tetratricopeptide repeat protein [Vampirovibrionia bacterium]
MSIETKDENFFYNIGKVYYQQGNINKAKENLKIALELNPNFREVKDFYNKFK